MNAINPAILNREVNSLPKQGGLPRRFWLVWLLIIICGTLMGCGKTQSKPMPKKSGSSEKNKSPVELSQIQASLDKLYQAMQQEPPNQTKTTQPAQQGGAQTQGGQQSGGQQGGTQQGTQQQAPPVSLQEVFWKKVTQQVETLHGQWNSFEPQAMKAGAALDDISVFETNINALLGWTSARDRLGALKAANKAAMILPNFMKLFESKIPPDLQLLVYMARDVAVRSQDADWTGAKGQVERMPDIWSRVRSEAKGEQKNTASQVQFSITDLTQAVSAKDQPLVKLKAGVLEKNLTEVLKALIKTGSAS
jgi:hypothetical protein